MTESEKFTQNVQKVSGFDALFLQGVLDLLSALGYTLQSGDSVLLGFMAQKVEQEIKNACNVSSVPAGLNLCAMGLIVAEFLMAKKNMGGLEGFALNFEAVVKQLQEGDTNIVWATDNGLTPEQRFESFIAFLLSGRGQFVSYRRLKW